MFRLNNEVLKDVIIACHFIEIPKQICSQYLCRPVIQDTLFALSPLYYAALSFVVTILVAMAVSLATGKCQLVIA